ncbi:MAG: ABC transporter substrate-binding protein [Micrococcales bacterium]
MVKKAMKAAVLATALAFTLSACGTAGGTNTSDLPTKLGDSEATLSLLGWPGYAEDGTNDPAIDWVTPFEEATGCQVTFKPYGTSDEAISLFKSGDYDVIAASGDATLRLIAAGDVQQLNTDLIPSYANVYDFLKGKAWNTVDGKVYGVPHGYGANLLMYKKDVVSPEPTSWDVVFDKASAYSGKVTAYDSPIYIADAAVYLMAHKPELGIKNPYALDETQLQAAVDLLKAQRAHVGEYWSDYLKEIQAFETGDSVVGTTWQVIVNSMSAEANVGAVLPSEGATGWSDSWMISSTTKSPNCAYRWLDYIDSPEANAAATEYFGEAPVTQAACDFMSSADTCTSYHAGDAEYASKIWYWTTPIATCLDGRTDVQCTDYARWTEAWTEIKG